jgi:hypothetical protein
MANDSNQTTTETPDEFGTIFSKTRMTTNPSDKTPIAILVQDESETNLDDQFKYVLMSDLRDWVSADNLQFHLKATGDADNDKDNIQALIDAIGTGNHGTIHLYKGSSGENFLIEESIYYFNKSIKIIGHGEVEITPTFTKTAVQREQGIFHCGSSSTVGGHPSNRVSGLYGDQHPITGGTWAGNYTSVLSQGDDVIDEAAVHTDAVAALAAAVEDQPTYLSLISSEVDPLTSDGASVRYGHQVRVKSVSGSLAIKSIKDLVGGSVWRKIWMCERDEYLCFWNLGKMRKPKPSQKQRILQSNR